MPERSKKRPRDPNQLADQIMLESTDQAEKFDPNTSGDLDPNKNPHAVALGKLGGLKGGPARAAALSARKRSQIAAKAAAKRWSTTTKAASVPIRKPTKPDAPKQ